MQIKSKLKFGLSILLILIGLLTFHVAFAQSADNVFKQYGAKTENVEKKIDYVAKLPNKSWQDTLINVVKTLLNITGSLALIAFTTGGIFMVTAAGNPEQVDKGKKIMIYSIIGLLIIAASYAVVLGVSQLQFFTPGTSNSSQNSQPPQSPAASTPDDSGTQYK